MTLHHEQSLPRFYLLPNPPSLMSELRKHPLPTVQWHNGAISLPLIERRWQYHRNGVQSLLMPPPVLQHLLRSL